MAAVSLILYFSSERVIPYIPGAEAARGEEITNSLSRDLHPGAPSLLFTDAASETGLSFEHFHGSRSTQLPEDMGSGAAWGDYDDDGDPDLYLVNESGPLTGSDEVTPSRSSLFRNDAGRFVDVTDEARVAVHGCGMGAAWGDVDNDGDLDLVVTRLGTLVLFRNDGDGTFTDISEETGMGDLEAFWTGASWSDFDKDGDLDLYVTAYVEYRFNGEDVSRTSFQYGTVLPYMLNPSSYEPARNVLLRNDAGRFIDVAEMAGVQNAEGRSLSASWCDFDQDGWSDLYVANDISDNAMYWNRGDGTFADVSHAAWVADYRGAMGLGVGDWDADGDMDIFVTHWIAQENALYENLHEKMPPSPEEPMHFIDQADMFGLGQIALDFIGWGTGFADFDNDGRVDLFVANGSTFPDEKDPSLLVPMKNHLFWNAGPGEGFYEIGVAAGEAFAVENVARGSATADYDADGDLDVAVVVNGGPARLLRNDSTGLGSWSRVVLRGSPGSTTTSHAEGAVVRATTGAVSQVRQIGCGSSYMSQDPPGEIHFGLGGAERIDSLEIVWPGGGRQVFRDLPVRTTLVIREGEEPRAATHGSKRDLAKEDLIRFWRGVREASRLRLAGDLDTAIEAYRGVLEIDPMHEDSLYYLGQSLLQTGRRGEARRALARLLEINPESSRAHVALGGLLATGGGELPRDLATAEDHFRRAHAINAEETGPMVKLGEVLIVQDRRQEAREWLEAAATSNPKSVEAACLAGYLWWEKGDLGKAREYHRRAVEATVSEAPVADVLGEGDRRPGDPRPGTLSRPTSLFSEPCHALPAVEAGPDSAFDPVRRFVASLR